LADIFLNSSFFKDTSDTSWLSSLAQAASSPPPPLPLSPPHAISLIDTARGSASDSAVLPRPSSDSGDKLLQDRCTALLKENAGLTAEVIRLHDFEAGKIMLLRVYSLRLRNSAP
jgi:hypothetical protein